MKPVQDNLESDEVKEVLDSFAQITGSIGEKDKGSWLTQESIRQEKCQHDRHHL